MDDLLLSVEQESAVRLGTIKLLNFRGEKGLRVSKPKLQFVMQEVKYLGHIIGHGTKKLSPERIEGILNLSTSKTNRQIRQALGLIGHCQLWTDECCSV